METTGVIVASVTRKARKKYICQQCNGKIPEGSEYCYFTVETPFYHNMRFHNLFEAMTYYVANFIDPPLSDSRILYDANDPSRYLLEIKYLSFEDVKTVLGDEDSVKHEDKFDEDDEVVVGTLIYPDTLISRMVLNGVPIIDFGGLMLLKPGSNSLTVVIDGGQNIEIDFEC